MNKKKSPALFVTEAGIIAAVYATATVLQNVLLAGSASFAVQVRVSEALTVLSVLTPAAIPGLTIGCAVSNLTSAGALPFDFLIGPLATFLSGILMFRMKERRIKNVPVMSFLMPVIFNAVFIGAELAVMMPLENKSRLLSFIIQLLLVAAGESVAVFLLGLPLFKALEKRKLFDKHN